MSVLRRVRKIPEWKIKEVEFLADLLRKYYVVAIADLTKLPTAQLQQIRKALRKKVFMRVSKNTLMRIAIDKVLNEKHGLEKLKEYLEGSNIFLFTNINPFELYMLLEKYKIPTYAKPGDVVDREVVIPAGNTGIPPGPILSTFGKLKIPTKIQEGTIWIAKDTVVAKPGDKISPELASILQKLDIKPLEVGVKLKVAYADGLVFKAEDLKLDLEKYRSDIAEAYLNALKLGVEVAFPEPEILKPTITKAYISALAVAVEAAFITDETAEYVLAKYIGIAYALASQISQLAPELGLEVAPVQAPQAKPEEKEEEKKEEEEEKKEEVTEEEIAAGLESLFG